MDTLSARQRTWDASTRRRSRNQPLGSQMTLLKAISGVMLLGSLALSPCRIYGQSAGKPEFEVADIRVNKSGDPQSADFLAGGQVSLRSMTMRTLIGLAWKESRVLPELTALSIAVSPSVAQFNVLSSDYLKGGPPWLNSDRF